MRSQEELLRSLIYQVGLIEIIERVRITERSLRIPWAAMEIAMRSLGGKEHLGI